MQFGTTVKELMLTMKEYSAIVRRSCRSVRTCRVRNTIAKGYPSRRWRSGVLWNWRGYSNISPSVGSMEDTDKRSTLVNRWRRRKIYIWGRRKPNGRRLWKARRHVSWRREVARRARERRRRWEIWIWLLTWGALLRRT